MTNWKNTFRALSRGCIKLEAATWSTSKTRLGSDRMRSEWQRPCQSRRICNYAYVHLPIVHLVHSVQSVHSVHSAFARFSLIELMEHWCFEQLWLRLRSKPPGKFLTKKLSMAKKLFQSWAQSASTRTCQRTQHIPHDDFPCRSVNSWSWALHQVGNESFMSFHDVAMLHLTLSESVQAQGPPEKAPQHWPDTQTFHEP